MQHSQKVSSWKIVNIVMICAIMAVLFPMRPAHAQIFRVEPPKAKIAVWQSANKRYNKRQIDKLYNAFLWRLLTTKVVHDENGKLDEVKWENWRFALNDWQLKIGCSDNSNASCKFRGIKTADQLIHSFFDIASTRSALRLELTAFRASLTHKSVYGNFSNQDTLRSVIMPSVKRYSWQRLFERQEAADRAEERAALEWLEEGKLDAASKTQVNEYLKHQPVKFQNFNAQAYAQEHRDEPVFETLQNSFQADGSLTLREGQLSQLTRAELARVNAGIDEIRGTLGRIDAAQGDILGYMNDAVTRARMQALAEAEAARHELKLQASRSSIYDPVDADRSGKSETWARDLGYRQRRDRGL